LKFDLCFITGQPSLEKLDTHRLRVYENRVLRRISGPRERKWWEVAEDA
jgi:hypothetical protein